MVAIVGSVLAIGAGVLVFGAISGRGVLIVVENVDTLPISEAVVIVADRRYSVGSIAPGESKSSLVHPMRETHVEIETVNELGATKRLHVGEYVAPGLTGEIRVKVTGEQVISVDGAIRTD
jgi:hypothetical protein